MISDQVKTTYISFLPVDIVQTTHMIIIRQVVTCILEGFQQTVPLFQKDLFRASIKLSLAVSQIHVRLGKRVLLNRS